MSVCVEYGTGFNTIQNAVRDRMDQEMTVGDDFSLALLYDVTFSMQCICLYVPKQLMQYVC